jgi:uncharacterized membrane protein
VIASPSWCWELLYEHFAIASSLPQVSVTIGLILSVVTFASLIILIQHISIMLEAPNIVAVAGAELM